MPATGSSRPRGRPAASSQRASSPRRVVSGGPTALGAILSCPNYHPKLSDLVITGAAGARYRRSAFEFDSVSEVLKTRRMVALDWRRSVLVSGALPCLRREMINGLGSTAKLVSFRKLPFP